MQAEELQFVQKELLAVREGLNPLRKRRQKELMKDKSDENELDKVKKLFAHFSAKELQLLHELERLETRPAGLEIGQHVLEFAAAIPDFPEQPDEDGFLHFPVPVLFLEGSSVMLVREVYQELWEHIANSTLKGFVVKESLKILGDFPRHVFADSSDDQPLAEVERAVADLTVGDLASGFDRHAVRSRDSATSRLTMIAPSRWREVGDLTSWEVTFRAFNITGRVADKTGPHAIGRLINGY